MSLLFVGVQIRQNTAAIVRGEHNSTMSQWTVLRQGIAQNREIAELMTAGLSGERGLDAADELRLDQFLSEYAWAAFHIWDRTQRGVFPQGTFELTGGAAMAALFRTPGGSSWWRTAGQEQFKHFVPPFVADVDALLTREVARPVARSQE